MMETTTYRTPDEKSALRDALAIAEESVFQVNQANGWFEDDRTVGDDIALIHSEASEMLEAYRDGGLEDQTKDGPVGFDLDSDTSDVVFMPKPEGFGSEAADVLIRLLDTCRRRGVDLAYEFERKLRYNGTRGHRHGGKVL
ncbi:MazG-like nucleotide pyrophosphohydrolase [Microbacterium phage SallyK]|nr:MazG-like nucleotide pyrophosphohydrolase [Microbacterium phage SallyK]